MKKPRQLPARPPLQAAQIGTCKYVGSPEHKVQAWWGGQPEAWLNKDGVASRPGRQLTTICRLTGVEDRERATGWVRDALRRGQLQYREADKDFPWRIWYEAEDGQFWMGQCVNSVAGHYKGWPISQEDKVEVFG